MPAKKTGQTSNDSEEAVLAFAVKLLQYKYPGVLFKTHWIDGAMLRQGAVFKLARLSGRRGFPDITICEPVNGYHGLFLELKREGHRLKKKDGSWLDDHVREQAQLMAELRQKGYAVGFACGREAVENALRLYFDFGQNPCNTTQHAVDLD
jgi:VRR-NUC domain